MAGGEGLAPEGDGDPPPERIAVIDVGSNSIRLVVYHGLSRSPAPLFNEKVMAGLGRGLQKGGLLADDAMDVALAALARFQILLRGMAVTRVCAVATAAVRDAANGPAFIERVRREAGLDVAIIDGGTEARGSAAGVIAGMPDADGIVGDLGGGSLELVRVRNGEAQGHVSLPLGALRLQALHREAPKKLAKLIERELLRFPWPEEGRGRPFYAVGGSWRALAQFHMHLADWPLPVVHEYRMDVGAPDHLVRSLAHMGPKSLKAVPSLSASRAPQLPTAAILLRAIVRRLQSSAIRISAFGLREGLLYQALPPAIRAEDPLLSGAREAAIRLGRFSDGSDAALGDALLFFSDGLFPDEAPALRRLRHAACLLADTSWRAQPDLRAEDGMDRALHNSWGGIDPAGRAMLAAALWAVNGGALPGPYQPLLARLASPQELQRAGLWGLTLRLGKRLTGGVPAPLLSARLGAGEGKLVLTLGRDFRALYGQSVARRHRVLAQALGLEPAFHLQDDLLGNERDPAPGRHPASAS